MNLFQKIMKYIQLKVLHFRLTYSFPFFKSFLNPVKHNLFFSDAGVKQGFLLLELLLYPFKDSKTLSTS